jgi:ATP-dependent protease ClpP protease subunit
MANSEVLLYGTINSYSAKQFVTELNALSGKDKTVHLNGNGGEVKYGLACLTNLAKSKDITLCNDAEANSMLAFMFCYPAKAKKCADYSTFGFHRAAYPEWYESDPALFTDEDKVYLDKTNANLRAAMEGTVDAVQWMKETNCSLDELFSMNGRKEVIINAEQAKRLGLVDEVITVTPQKRKEITALRQTIEAKFSTQLPIAAQLPTPTPKKIKMTLAEFKSENPELFKEIVTAERERCETWAVYADVDIKAVQEGITSGKTISPKVQAEFIRKQVSAEQVIKIEAENPGAITLTAEQAKIAADAKKTEAEKTQAAAVEAVRKSLNLS